MTSKCASRHSRVHFLSSSTSKSFPDPVCLQHFVSWPHALFEQFNFQKCSEHDFSHFDLSMCFAPHPRALFGQLNFQKCSEPSVFLAFWLLNVLHATAAAQRPKVSRTFDFKTIGNSEIRFRNDMRPGDFRRHPPTVLLVTI